MTAAQQEDTRQPTEGPALFRMSAQEHDTRLARGQGNRHERRDNEHDSDPAGCWTRREVKDIMGTVISGR